MVSIKLIQAERRVCLCLLKPLWRDNRHLLLLVCTVCLTMVQDLWLLTLSTTIPHISGTLIQKYSFPIDKGKATQDTICIQLFFSAEPSWPCLDKVQQIVQPETVACLLPHTSGHKKENADEGSWSHSTES